jgi:hypothetical protein
MDCCMNRVTLMPPGEPRVQPRASSDTPLASFVAFAAQRPLKAVEMPIDADGQKVHGLFTWTLLEGLRGAAADTNGRVTGRGLADWIRNAMSARMTDADLNNVDVSKDPEVIQEDESLVFVRGVSKPSIPIELSFPAQAVQARARLWGGAPPQVVREFSVTSTPERLSLRPGLYLVDVPQARLRQGFEAVRAKSISITEVGDAVTEAAAGTIFPLDVDPGDPTAEIFVVDHQFSLADNDTGRLSTPLPFGLYKIKTRIGRARKERVILLDQDHPQIAANLIAESTPTVVPIVGTPSSHEYQADARETAQSTVTTPQVPGDGATLMVMARTFGLQGVAPDTRPWEGVSIVDARGATVIDFEREGDEDIAGREAARPEPHAAQDPYAIRTKQVAPGVYFLRQKLDDGTSIEQSLIACAGWRVEVHVLRVTAEGSTSFDSRPRISVMMGRPGKASDPEEDRIVETARFALADERRILNAELETLLMRKFDNPIAAMIGAHLLLIERERDPSRDLTMLDEVVANLERLVGPDHPDVVALALRCATAQVPQGAKLMGPPMFQRSWTLLVEGAQTRSSLIPAAMWGRIQAQGTLPPFLIWTTDENLKSSVRKVLAQVILPELMESPEATSAIVGKTAAPVGASAASSVAETVTPFTKEMLRIAKQRAAGLCVPPSALTALKKETK